MMSTLTTVQWTRLTRIAAAWTRGACDLTLGKQRVTIGLEVLKPERLNKHIAWVQDLFDPFDDDPTNVVLLTGVSEEVARMVCKERCGTDSGLRFFDTEPQYCEGFYDEGFAFWPLMDDNVVRL